MLYEPLAVEDLVDPVYPASTRRVGYRTRFQIARNVFGVFLSILVGLYLGFRTGFVRLDGVGFTRASRPSCRHHYHLDTPGAAGLPTHYTLPSGDKIPSVALGTAAAAVNIMHLSP